MPQAVCQRLARHAAEGKVVYTDKPQTVVAGIMVTGFVPRQTGYEQIGSGFCCDERGSVPDYLPDDQSLLIHTSRGVVLVFGCAHAGVVNTLMYAETLSEKPIYALIGGMHLRSASDERIERTLEEIEKREIGILGPMHCTGDTATEMMRERFPDAYRQMAGGEAIVVEARPSVA